MCVTFVSLSRASNLESRTSLWCLAGFQIIDLKGEPTIAIPLNGHVLN